MIQYAFLGSRLIDDNQIFDESVGPNAWKNMENRLFKIIATALKWVKFYLLEVENREQWVDSSSQK